MNPIIKWRLQPAALPLIETDDRPADDAPNLLVSLASSSADPERREGRERQIRQACAAQLKGQVAESFTAYARLVSGYLGSTFGGLLAFCRQGPGRYIAENVWRQLEELVHDNASRHGLATELDL